MSDLQTTRQDQIWAALTDLCSAEELPLAPKILPFVTAALAHEALDPAETLSPTAAETIRKVIYFYVKNNALVEGLKAQDDESVITFLNMIYPWATNCLTKNGAQLDSVTLTDLASDICHQVVLAFLNYDYRYDRELEAVAYQFVKNFARNALRKQTAIKQQINTNALPLDDDLAAHPILDIRRLEDRLAAEDLAALLAAGIRQLPHNQQEVIIAHYFEGIPLREIAARMGKTPNNIYQFKLTGLRALKQWLREEGNSDGP